MAKNEAVDAEVVDDIDESTALDNYRGGGDVATRIGGLNNPGQSFWTSITGDDFDSKKKVAAALASATPLMDHLNEEFGLVDIVIQSVEILDDNTGEYNTAPRVTLIDENGNAYNATSVGVLSSIEQLVNVLGQPSTWPAPLKVKAVEERGKRGYRFMTLKMV